VLQVQTHLQDHGRGRRRNEDPLQRLLHGFPRAFFLDLGLTIDKDRDRDRERVL